MSTDWQRHSATTKNPGPDFVPPASPSPATKLEVDLKINGSPVELDGKIISDIASELLIYLQRSNRHCYGGGGGSSAPCSQQYTNYVPGVGGGGVKSSDDNKTKPLGRRPGGIDMI